MNANVSKYTDTDSSENDENPAILDIDYSSEASDTTAEVEEEPDSTPTMPNFTKLLEDRITAYCHKKYSSEKDLLLSQTKRSINFLREQK